MLVRALAASAMILSLTLFTIAAFAAETPCPIQLEESHTQSLLIAQSRDQLEQRLAQAIRANHELSQHVDRLTAEHKKLTDDLKALQAPKPEAPKPEAPK